LETKRSDKQRDRDVEFEQIKAALDLDLTGRNSSQQPKRAMLGVQDAYRAWPAGPVFRHGQAARIDLLLPCSRRRTTRF